MAAELKAKVVRGFVWNIAEKVASILFQAWVTINVANRLYPEDYAMKAICVAFVLVFNTFVDSGFSQALIRDKTATHTDYSSAFWFNIAMAIVLYAILVGLSYPSAQIFDMPDLVRFAPVFFLVIPVGALGIIQQAVLTREFDFRRLSTIGFVSTVGGGLIGVTLAFAGFGFWAIVGQRVGLTAVRSLLLWIFGRWRPTLRFSGTSIRSMFGFSSRLLGTDLLNNLYNSIPNFIIGHIYGNTLGHYNQALQTRDLPVSATMNAMQSVTFPALASIREDDRKFSGAVGRVVESISFLMFPMMAGFMVVADEMFGVFLAPQWQASVSFFRILCIGGFAMPLTVVASNILRTRSDGKAVLRAEMVKKALATAILAATIPFGAMSIACGVVGIAFTDAIVSLTVARRQSSYGFGALARNVLPILALTAAMAGAVWGVGIPVAAWPMWIVLTLKILTGVGVYMGGAALLRLNGFREFTEILCKLAGKIRATSKPASRK